MSYALIPNFAASPPPCIERVRFHADPILAAIDAHEEAWAVFLVASEGVPTEHAAEVLHDALDGLLVTPCATRHGTEALLRHLRRVIREQAIGPTSSLYADHLVLIREHDLSLLIGADLAPTRLPLATPLGRLPGAAPVQAPVRQVIEAAPARSPALVRLTRAVSTAGDALAAMILIAGGCGLVGFASLL